MGLGHKNLVKYINVLEYFGFPTAAGPVLNNLWNTDPLTGAQYQINSQSSLMWHQASKSCQQQNADLLCITELSEQMFVAGKLLNFVNVFYFKIYIYIHDENKGRYLEGVAMNCKTSNNVYLFDLFVTFTISSFDPVWGLFPHGSLPLR